MAQHAGQGLHIHTAGDRHRGECVTQIVEADTGQSRVLEQRFHVGVGAAGVDGVLRPHRIREYPRPDGVRLASPQDIDYTVRQDDGAHALIGLRLADGVRTLPLAMKGAAHLQRTGGLVEVAPLQTADLTAPQARHQLDLKEVTPHIILLHHFKEGIQLRSCQDALGLVVGLGCGRTLSGVPGNDVRLHRVFHRAVHHEVNVADRGVGELIVHLWVFTDAPVLFQAAVHPLNILLGDERHLFVAQLRLDVEFDVAAVVGEGAGAYRSFFVLRDPAIQPFAQRHTAVLCQFHVAVALDVLVELVQQCLLGLGVDVAEQRLTVFLVADNDAALPAAILTLAYHAITGWSSFCHWITSDL